MTYRRHPWTLERWPWPDILKRFEARAADSRVDFRTFARTTAARFEVRLALISERGLAGAAAVTAGQITWICRQAITMKEREGER